MFLRGCRVVFGGSKPHCRESGAGLLPTRPDRKRVARWGVSPALQRGSLQAPRAFLLKIFKFFFRT